MYFCRNILFSSLVAYHEISTARSGVFVRAHSQGGAVKSTFALWQKKGRGVQPEVPAIRDTINVCGTLGGAGTIYGLNAANILDYFGSPTALFSRQ